MKKAYCIGVVNDPLFLTEDLSDEGIKKGDLFIFLEDTPENRRVQAELLLGRSNSSQTEQ